MKALFSAYQPRMQKEAVLSNTLIKLSLSNDSAFQERYCLSGFIALNGTKIHFLSEHWHLQTSSTYTSSRILSCSPSCSIPNFRMVLKWTWCVLNTKGKSLENTSAVVGVFFWIVAVLSLPGTLLLLGFESWIFSALTMSADGGFIRGESKRRRWERGRLSPKCQPGLQQITEFQPPLLMCPNCITSPGIDGNLNPCLHPISGASDQLRETRTLLRDVLPGDEHRKCQL